MPAEDDRHTESPSPSRATSGGRLKRYGTTFAVADPHVMTKAEAAAHVTGWWRLAFARIPFEQAVLLRRV